MDYLPQYLPKDFKRCLTFLLPLVKPVLVVAVVLKVEEFSFIGNLSDISSILWICPNFLYFYWNFFYDKITVKRFMSKFTTLAVQFDETFMLALATFKTLALVIPISTFNKNTYVDNFPALKNIHQL